MSKPTQATKSVPILYVVQLKPSLKFYLRSIDRLQRYIPNNVMKFDRLKKMMPLFRTFDTRKVQIYVVIKSENIESFLK